MSYEVKIDAFEGPIPLLLHLIKNNEVEIYDISIAKITDQYLDYIAAMQKLDLEIASEFLVMAANLIEIKSSMLLPDEPEEEDEEEVDPRQQLINRLLEYKKYKDLATRLRDYEEMQRKRHTRSIESVLAEIDPEAAEDNPLEDISLNEFVTTFEEILAERIQEEKEKQEEEKESKEKLSDINRKEVNIQDKMAELEQKLKKKEKVKFAELFAGKSNKLEIVVTFMALLELMRLRKIIVEQTGIFTEINVRLIR